LLKELDDIRRTPDVVRGGLDRNNNEVGGEDDRAGNAADLGRGVNNNVGVVGGVGRHFPMNLIGGQTDHRKEGCGFAVRLPSQGAVLGIGVNQQGRLTRPGKGGGDLHDKVFLPTPPFWLRKAMIMVLPIKVGMGLSSNEGLQQIIKNNLRFYENKGLQQAKKAGLQVSG